MTLFLSLALGLMCCLWVRERALRQGDRARIRHIVMELELSAYREQQLISGVQDGLKGALICIAGLYADAQRDDDEWEWDAEDVPNATRH